MSGGDTVVIDLDGTLANVDHRRHLVSGKKKDYAAFHALADLDVVNEPIATLIYAMHNVRNRIVVVSARPKSMFQITSDWLESNQLLQYIQCVFLLRPDGDNTPDQILKATWLKSFGKEKILFVVDDRQKVVDMWRENGVTCLQCAAWKEAA